MSEDKIVILERAIAQEQVARKNLELKLEKKEAELHEANQKLEKLYFNRESVRSKKDSQLQGVFENIVDSYVIMDLSGNILKLNDAASNLLGFENDKIDYNLLNMVSPEDYTKVSESFKKLLQEGVLIDFEIKITTNLNLEKLININASVIYNDGIPVAAQGIVRDITKVKEAENKLIESESKLTMLILNLDAGVLLVDEFGKIVNANMKFCEIFKIPLNLENLIGQDCLSSVTQSKFLFKNPEDFAKNIEAILKTRELVLGEELHMIDGRVFDRDYIPIFIKGYYKGHLWKYKDITLKQNYRKSIENQRLKYRSIIRNMNLGLIEVDTEDRILMVNQSLVEMTGYSQEELVGIKGIDILPISEDVNLLNQKVEERKKGKIESYELRIKHKNGELRYWLVSGAPNYDIEGNVIGSIGVNFDITELKNLQIEKENLLSELEKSNNELIDYAHIVSHDLKSPLRSINALIHWIKEDNTDKLDAVSIRNFDLIETTLENMEHLISDILEYSSVGSLSSQKTTVNTNELINELLKVIYIPEHINIHIITPLPFITGHKIKLQQLFQNLISNAIKFIDKEKGIININVEELDDYYQFSVEDNGIGIEERFHSKIFKIFHALKKSKDSTGIGLSIVQKIVDLHGGKIWLESTPNIGSIFFFTLKK